MTERSPNVRTRRLIRLKIIYIKCKIRVDGVQHLWRDAPSYTSSKINVASCKVVYVLLKRRLQKLKL